MDERYQGSKCNESNYNLIIANKNFFQNCYVSVCFKVHCFENLVKLVLWKIVTWFLKLRVALQLIYFLIVFSHFFLTVHDCDNSLKHFVKGCGSMFIMYSIDSLVGTLTLVKTDFNIISAENVYRLDSQDSLKVPRSWIVGADRCYECSQDLQCKFCISGTCVF